MSDFEDAKLILTPNAYKAGKAYCVKPFDGSGDFTVVRNTTATRVDKNGLIEVVGANVPRVNYPISGGCPSWLLEPQATNLVTYSEDFSQSWWTKSCDIESNALIQPDNSTSGFNLVEKTSTAYQYWYKSGFSVTIGNSYTFSAFVKYIDLRYVQLTAYNGGAYGSACFDLVSKTFTTATGGGYTATNAKIEEYANDWLRIQFTFTSPATSTIPSICASNTASAGYVPLYVGTGLKSAVWGAQIEEGNLSSYIPTTGTTVTRNGEVTTIAPPSGTTEIVETLKDITYYIGGNNLLTYSEEFDNAYWIKSATEIIPNQIISPDGNLNADKIYPTSSGNFRHIRQASYSPYTGTYCMSIFAKKGELSNILLIDYDGAGVGINYNLDTGVATSYATIPFISFSMENVGNDWYRCIATATNGYFYWMVTNGGNSVAVTANGTDGIYIWGAQVEQGATATTYQATRDIVTVPTSYQLPNGEIKKVIMT